MNKKEPVFLMKQLLNLMIGISASYLSIFLRQGFFEWDLKQKDATLFFAKLHKYEPNFVLFFFFFSKAQINLVQMYSMYIEICKFILLKV